MRQWLVEHNIRIQPRLRSGALFPRNFLRGLDAFVVGWSLADPNVALRPPHRVDDPHTLLSARLRATKQIGFIHDGRLLRRGQTEAIFYRGFHFSRGSLGQ